MKGEVGREVRERKGKVWGRGEGGRMKTGEQRREKKDGRVHAPHLDINSCSAACKEQG